MNPIVNRPSSIENPVKIVINAASAKLGGAVSYLAGLLQHLPPPESGYRFFVFLPGQTAKLLPDVRGNIELCALPSKSADGWRRLWWEQITLRRFLRKEKVDFLFSTANFAMLRCPVRQILLVRNALYFSKIYQDMFLGRHGLRYRLAFAFRRWMVVRSVRCADVVMTPTQTMLDDLAQFAKVDRRKALVNHYGATLPSRPEPSPPWGGGSTAPGIISRQGGPGLRPPEGYGPSERTPCYGPQAGEAVPPPISSSAGQDTGGAPAEPTTIRLIYVSLYGEHKNLSTLLKAMPLLNRDGGRKFLLRTTMDPGWEFIRGMVTCEGDLALAQDPEVSPWIQILGPVGREAALEVYREGDIFVFPALCESFGQPMAEAMAHGLPIVASDTAVNREVCAGAAVYFSPLSAEELALQIKAVTKDQALMRKLGMLGRERAVTEFRWDRHVQRILQCSGGAKQENPQRRGVNGQ
jgi:glycosyltransferase involved in cell wall biosynthesis